MRRATAVSAALLFARVRCHALVLLVMCGVVASPPAAAVPLETRAQTAILLDGNTGTVLYEKNADTRMYPASMTKVLTAYVVFDQLKKGRITLDDTFTVSEHAWRQGGSRTFLDLGSKVAVRDLVQGMIIQSGNDASVTLAEGLAGTEEAFADAMTAKGRELGMTNTMFYNVTGWPHPEHMTTVRDMATLATRMIKDFPEYYEFYSKHEFTYNGIRQGIRNPLIQQNFPGADGLKTGYTNAAGYCLTGSAVRNGLRLVMVVGGLKSPKERADESRKILEWGFREYRSYTLFKPEDTTATAKVWLGVRDSVPLATKEPVVLTMPAADAGKVKIKVIYNEPLTAPVLKGTEVGRVEVLNVGTDNKTITLPLYAKEDVNSLGFAEGMRRKIDFLVSGKM
jgi:serine-type D-Ala-D-Ala carboxypeptidase (penicillin-binding protein 5/6)